MVTDCVQTRKKRGSDSYATQQKKAINQLRLNKVIFTVGNLLQLQRKGILTRTDPESIWSNLYLYDYEADFISKLNRIE